MSVLSKPIAEPWELTRLQARHFKILDLALGGNGPKEIAQALDMSPQSISLIMKSPLFQTELARRREQVERQQNTEMAMLPVRVKQQLDQLGERAVAKVGQLLDSDDDAVALRAANSVLDKVLGSGEKESKPIIVIEKAQIQLLQVALQEVNNDCKEGQRVSSPERINSSELGKLQDLEGCEEEIETG